MFGEYTSEVFSFLGGLAGGGLLGSFLTIRLNRQKRATMGAQLVDQSESAAGGDIVGRDKISGHSSPTPRPPGPKR